MNISMTHTIIKKSLLLTGAFLFIAGLAATTIQSSSQALALDPAKEIKEITAPIIAQTPLPLPGSLPVVTDMTPPSTPQPTTTSPVAATPVTTAPETQTPVTPQTVVPVAAAPTMPVTVIPETQTPVTPLLTLPLPVTFGPPQSMSPSSLGSAAPTQSPTASYQSTPFSVPVASSQPAQNSFFVGSSPSPVAGLSIFAKQAEFLGAPTHVPSSTLAYGTHQISSQLANALFYLGLIGLLVGGLILFITHPKATKAKSF